MANTIQSDTCKIHSLPADRKYLNKNECLKEAHRILDEGYVENMTQSQIAREIYFHASAYHISRNSKLLCYIRNHADPIDLCSGGDRKYRQIIYAVCWVLPLNRRHNKK